MYFVFVWHYGMNTLKGDDWVFVPLVDVAQHGHLTLGILWAQYNESHMLIPKLLWIIFGLTTHTDTKIIMLFDALLFTASYAFLLVVYRRTAGSWLGPIQVIVVGLVWFSLADWENALWGFQMAWYLSLLFFMAMLLVLSRREITRLGLTAAVVFAAAASLCTVQGLLVWPVGLLCILWRVEGRGRWISLGGPWVAGGVATASVYFWQYNSHTAAGGAGVGASIFEPATVIEYLLAEVGNVFPGNYSVALHAWVGFALLSAAAGVLIASWYQRKYLVGPPPLPLPVALIAFALLFDLSVAVARLSFGLSSALWPRYTMANLLLILGIVLFLVPRLPRRLDAVRISLSPYGFVACVILIALLLTQIATSAKYGIDSARADSASQSVGARIATNLSRVVPASARPELVTTYLYPSYGDFLVIAAIARQDQLGEFIPESYRHYRALGPPEKSVQIALAVVRQTLGAWCKLAPGDTRPQVYDQLGSPHGEEFAPWARGLAKAGYLTNRYAEWDVGNDVLIADFKNGRAMTLQAFAAQIPNRATDTPCSATRS
ncbi:MAG TPA: hypothetical protein VG032_04885 [Acidimicrobiales bacterium]|nr:hypothetical protein [Acidimicrobiales bacterium]